VPRVDGPKRSSSRPRKNRRTRMRARRNSGVRGEGHGLRRLAHA
jgi:hypothetical protein